MISQDDMYLWWRHRVAGELHMELAERRLKTESVEAGEYFFVNDENGGLQVESRLNDSASSGSSLSKFREIGKILREPGEKARDEYFAILRDLRTEVESAGLGRLSYLLHSPRHSHRNALYVRVVGSRILWALTRLWWAGTVTHRLSQPRAVIAATEAMRALRGTFQQEALA